jgi:2-C-methyl-D-erythritol 4-phosphate cytidylyltransferase
VALILVAAGSGTRLGADVPKAFVPLAGVPILGHALRGALSCPDVAEVVVVAPPAWLAQAEQVCRWVGSRAHAQSGAHPVAPSSERDVPVTVVAGGAERGESVAAGLAALSSDVEIVLVHDAARCLTPVEVFDRVVAAVRSGAPAVVPGLAVVDTIKEVDDSGTVIGTPDRGRLRAVQTPQGFRLDVLLRAHALPDSATDDAALVERLGEAVLVVDGDPRALKITIADDLDTAARILAG